MNANRGHEDVMVPLDLLRRYLFAHGWSRLPIPATSAFWPLEGPAGVARLLNARSGGRRTYELFVYREGGDEEDVIEIVVPTENRISDYGRRIEDVIRTLSQFENRSPVEIVADIRSIGFDVIRSTLPDYHVENDSIRLEIAANYISEMRQLMVVTATTESNPDPYFLRVKKEAKEYVGRCRFGHTFRGSFGFVIESPIGPNNEPALMASEQVFPYERRVIQRMSVGIQSIVAAVESGDVSQIVNNYKVGFSANSCEQFAYLIENSVQTGIVLEFSFTPEWPQSSSQHSKFRFQIDSRHAEISRVAAKEMRSKPVLRQETIVGKVVRLASDSDPNDLLSKLDDREIAIRWNSEDGELLVRVHLSPEDYLRAVDAHRNGLQVSISGTLEKRGRRWFLKGPNSFAVISQ